MRAIIIDPEKRLISVGEYNGNIREIQEIIGCDVFECPVMMRKGDTLFVDEMGLFKPELVEWLFKYNDFTYTFLGKAMIIGSNVDGESRDALIGVDQVESMVTFHGR